MLLTSPRFWAPAVVLALLPTLVDLATRVRFAPPAPQRSAVLITGCSSGLGAHAARHLAAAGGLVVFAGARDDAALAALAAAGDARVRPLRIDVADAASRAAALRELRAACARDGLTLHALVNNAGLGTGVPLELETDAAARQMLEVNFFAALNLTQALLPDLRASGGRVVMVSSVQGRFAVPGRGLYGASKFALEAASDSLRMELLPLGVSVSVVEPGYVRSAIVTSGRARRARAEAEAEAAAPGRAALRAVYARFFSEAAERRHEQQNERGADPLVVSEALLHAVADEHPRTRYLVAGAAGLPARALDLLRLLPDRLRDALLLRLA